MSERFNHYNDYKNGGSCWKFINANPEFRTDEFEEWIIQYNRGDRDSGELEDIAYHEILRLAHTFVLHRWNFPNVYADFKKED